MPHHEQLQQWLASTLGQYALQQEIEALNTLLPSLAGHYLLRLGFAHELELDAWPRIRRDYVMHTNLFQDGEAKLSGEADALPFPSNMLDIVVLSHVLEFEENPHAILREVERVLTADGQLIIIGFNPLSLWGLWRLSRRRGVFPWRGDFISSSRLKDWLSLLEFELCLQRTLCFAPPFRGTALRRRFAFMESAGSRWWPGLGGVYVLHARKRRIPMTLITPRWSKQPNLLGAARPAARQATETRPNNVVIFKPR